MPEGWVDFKAIKAAVTMQMVLDHYKVLGLKRVGDELRGPCPIHKGATNTKDLSVNLTKNAFKCFSDACKARGNVLDFVAAMEKCEVRDAALKLEAWFKIGDTDDPKKESENDNSLTPNTIESLGKLVAELEVYSSLVVCHASLIEAKTKAVKKILATFLKEV